MVSERPLTFEEWPVSRVFRGERFQDQVLRVVRVETGQEFFGSYNGSPIWGVRPDLRLVTLSPCLNQRQLDAKACAFAWF